MLAQKDYKNLYNKFVCISICAWVSEILTSRINIWRKMYLKMFIAGHHNIDWESFFKKRTWHSISNKRKCTSASTFRCGMPLISTHDWYNCWKDCELLRTETKVWEYRIPNPYFVSYQLNRWIDSKEYFQTRWYHQNGFQYNHVAKAILSTEKYLTRNCLSLRSGDLIKIT